MQDDGWTGGMRRSLWKVCPTSVGNHNARSISTSQNLSLVVQRFHVALSAVLAKQNLNSALLSQRALKVSFGGLFDHSVDFPEAGVA